MSIIKIFIFFGFLFFNTYSIETNRTYLIKKDFISGLKGGEFTVYDHQGKTRQYRMESKFGVLHDVRLYTLPSKTLIAQLKAKFTAVMYKAIISIFDEDDNQWINGTIQQNYEVVGNKFTIIWNENKILMEGTAASLNTQFIEESSKNILATFQKRIISLFWRNKYDLQILSNKYSDAIYFLGISAKDHRDKKNLVRLINNSFFFSFYLT